MLFDVKHELSSLKTECKLTNFWIISEIFQVKLKNYDEFKLKLFYS